MAGKRPYEAEYPRGTVLVVSYHWTPAHNVGVKQLAGLCRHLEQLGWRTVVLSRDWTAPLSAVDDGWGITVTQATPDFETVTAALRADGNVLRSVHGWLVSHGTGRFNPLVLVRRFLSLGWPLFGPYPDAFGGWVETAVEAGVRAAREQGCTAVLSTCPPAINHVVGGRIARATGLPWLVNFGDLFSFYVGVNDWHGTRYRRWLATRLNRAILRGAQRATAVSPRMGRLIEQLYAIPSQLLVVGYEPAEFRNVARVAGERMVISHVGSVYPGDQRPDLLFGGIDLLIQRFPALAASLQVRLVGSRREGELRALLRGRLCEPIVAVESAVDPATAIRIQQESDALLLLNLTAPQTAEGTLSYPSKVFEYFGARRRILALPSDGDWVDALLGEVGAGSVASTPEAIADVLRVWIEQWRRDGSLKWGGDDAKARKYSHAEQSMRLAGYLEEITARNHR